MGVLLIILDVVQSIFLYHITFLFITFSVILTLSSWPFESHFFNITRPTLPSSLSFHDGTSFLSWAYTYTIVSVQMSFHDGSVENVVILADT